MEASEFAGYTVGVVFLCFACGFYLLYSPKLFGLLAEKLLARLVLPEDTSLELGALSFAPMRMRVFFKGLRYFNQDMSIQAADGYLTFSYWGRIFGSDEWVPLRDRDLDKANAERQASMEEDAQELDPIGPLRTEGQGKKPPPKLINSRCQVRIEDVWYDAMIVDFNVETRTVNVRLHRPGNYNAPTPIVQHGLAIPIDQVYQVVVRDVRLLDNDTRLKVHLNGLTVSMHNSTAKYEALKKEEQPTKGENKDGEGAASAADSKENDADGKEKREESSAAEPLRDERGNIIYEKSLFERFMDFVKTIGIEAYAVSFNVGGLEQKHPYFLHLNSEHMDGSYCLTKNGIAPADRYRVVMDFFMTNVGCRWVPRGEAGRRTHTHSRTQSTDSDAEKKNPEKETWKEKMKRMKKGIARGAALVMSGENEANADAEENVSEHIQKFGTIIQPDSDANLRLLYYYDVPGDQTGEPFTTETLPKTGLEVDIDAEEMHYGPWADLCRKELTRHLFPLSYVPWPVFKAKIGDPRPYGLYEQHIEWKRSCRLIVPFKHKTVTPSPPFGIEDSGRVGTMVFEMGPRSKYVYKVPWIVYESEQSIICETLFRIEDCKIKTSYNDSYLLVASRADFFIDALYPLVWNHHQHWDFIMKFTECSMWYYNDFQTFVWDLIADLGYAPQLYHRENIQRFNTMEYNTEEYIPYAQRYEMFFEPGPGGDPGLKMYWNVNPNNVVYSPNGADVDNNSFLVTKAETASVNYFSPLDAYCMSTENEFKYTFDVAMNNVELELSLPPTHPMFHLQTKFGHQFLRVNSVSVEGFFSSMYQSLTQEQVSSAVPSAQSTGLSERTNTSRMNVGVDGAKGTMMGHHVRALAGWWNNYFTGDCSTSTPDEFFWLSNLHRSAENGRNTKYQYYLFQVRNEPRRNDLDLLMNVSVRDIEVIFSSGLPVAAAGNVQFTCSGMQFSTHSMAMLFEMSVSMNPSVVRWYKATNEANVAIDHENVLCIGAVTYSKASFYGSAPHYPCFASNALCEIAGLSGGITVQQLATVSHLLTALMQQYEADDPCFLQELQSAKNAAMQQDTQGPVHHEPIIVKSRGGKQKSYFDKVSPAILASRRKVRLTKDVPNDVTEAFVHFLDFGMQVAEEATEMGIFSTRASVASVQLNIGLSSNGVIACELPRGVQFTTTTLADGNSSSRTNVAIPVLCAKTLAAKTPEMLVADVAGGYLEVASIESGFAFRQTTAEASEGGSNAFLARQQDYVTAVNYLETFRLDFDAVNAAVRQIRSRAGTAMTARQAARKRSTAKGVGGETFSPVTVEFEDPMMSCSDVTEDDEESSRAGFYSCVSGMPSENEEVSSDGILSSEDGTSDQESTGTSTSAAGSPILARRKSIVEFREASPSPTLADSKGRKEKADFYRLLRPYESVQDVQRPTAPSYVPGAVFSTNVGRGTEEPRMHRSFVHSNAPLPNVSFVLARTDLGGSGSPSPIRELSTRAPSSLSSATRQEAAGGGRGGGGGGGGESTAKQFSWAERSADNTRRSREGCTTVQYHLEALRPVDTFLTIESIQLILSSEKAFHQQQAALHRAEGGRERSISKGRGAVSSPTVTEKPSSPGPQRHRKGQPRKREKNPRQWTATETIYSCALPLVRLVFLDTQHVSLKNTPFGAQRRPKGIYRTELVVSNSHLLTIVSQPPLRLTGNDAALRRRTTKRTLSVSFQDLSAAGYIVWEPLSRTRQYFVQLPRMTMDSSCSLVFGLSLDSFGLRAKNEIVGKHYSTFARLWVGDIELNCTREALYYVHCIFMTIVTEYEEKKQRSTASTQPQSHPQEATAENTELGGDAAEMDSTADGMTSKKASDVFHGETTGQQTELVLSVGSISIEMVDIASAGNNKDLLVDFTRPNRFSTTGISASCVAKMGSSSPTATQKAIVSLVVDVQQAKASIYPSLAEIIDFSAVGAHQATGVSPRSPGAGGNPKKASNEFVFVKSQLCARNLTLQFKEAPSNYVEASTSSLLLTANTRTSPVEAQTTTNEKREVTFELAPRIRHRLLSHATRVKARLAAFASAPTLDARIALTDTYAAFIDDIKLKYVANLSVLRNVKAADIGNIFVENSTSASTIVEASIASTQLSLQSAIASSTSKVKVEDFVNICVTDVLIDLPFRPNFVEVVNPQYELWMTAWKQGQRRFHDNLKRNYAVGVLPPSESPVSAQSPGMSGFSRSPVDLTALSAPPSSSSTKFPGGDGAKKDEDYPAEFDRHRIISFAVVVKSAELKSGLPKQTNVSLIFPETSVWLDHCFFSQREAIRAHIRAPRIVSTTEDSTMSILPLPQMYILANVEDEKSCATVMIDHFEAVVNVELVTHGLLAYDRVVSELMSMLTTATEEEPEPLPSLERKKGRAMKVAVVLAGARVSILSDLAELRLTSAGVNLSIDTTSPSSALRWAIHVEALEGGLYDRDDFDQRNSLQTTPQASSANLSQQRLASSGDTSSRERHRLQTGYSWGQFHVRVKALNHTCDSAASGGGHESGGSTPTAFAPGHGAVCVHCTVTEPTLVIRAGCAEHFNMLTATYTHAVEASKRELTTNQEKLTRALERSRQYQKLLYRSQRWRMSMASTASTDSGDIGTEYTAAPPTVVLVRIQRLIVVVPGGDAAYANLVKGASGQISCTKKSSSHVHSVSCLDRKAFIPFFALKLTMENASLTALVEPALLDPKSPASSVDFGGSVGMQPLQKRTLKLRFDQLHAFISDGTKIDPKLSPLPSLLETRKLTGGLGLLTEWQPAEVQRTKNRIFIEAGELQLRQDSGGEARTVTKGGLALAPVDVHLSSRSPILVEKILEEFDTGDYWFVDVPIPCEEPKPRSPSELHFSVSVASGNIIMHSLQPQATPGSSLTKTVVGRKGGLKRKKEIFQQHHDAAAQAQATQLITVPFPSIAVTLHQTHEHYDSNTHVYVSLRWPLVEIPPTMSILLHEVSHWRESTGKDHQERSANIINLIRSMEEMASVTKSLPTLHTSYLEAALPLPRAFASRVLDIRRPKRTTDQVSSSSLPAAPCPPLRQHFKTQSLGSAQSVPTPMGATDKAVYHVHISALKLALTCGTIAPTSLSLAVGEKEGSIDVIHTTVSTSGGGSSPVAAAGSGLGSVEASTSFVASQLLVECQAKMEMKCLEMIIPALEGSYAKTRTRSQVLMSIPMRNTDQRKNNGLEVTFRATHAAQLFLVQKLWEKNAEETKKQLPEAIKKAKTVIAEERQKAAATPMFIACNVARLQCKAELGIASKHEAVLSEVCIHQTSTPQATTTEAAADSVVVKSEGHLTGEITAGNGFVFHHRKARDSMRTALGLPELKAMYRERQLKEVFLFHVHSLQALAITSGIFEQSSKVSVLADKYTLGLTADTAPSLAALTTSFAEVLEEQSREAEQKANRAKFAGEVVTTASAAVAVSQNQTTPPPVEGGTASSPSRATGSAASPSREGASTRTEPQDSTYKTPIALGEVSIKVKKGEVLIGRLSTTAVGAHASEGGILLSLPFVGIEFAECEEEEIIKRVLMLELRSWEVARPSTKSRICILGSPGSNRFELFSMQGIDSQRVGYHMKFFQTHPWSGSPHVSDFEVLNDTIRSFSSTKVDPRQPSSEPKADPRTFYALSASRFAPELRVVGDMSMNVDVVLGWLGISEGLVPILLYTSLCDPLESVLLALGSAATDGDEEKEEEKEKEEEDTEDGGENEDENEPSLAGTFH